MKKYLLLLILLASCKPPDSHIEKLQQQIDSLQTQIKRVYKPGFGASMNLVHHHFKELYKAGKQQNWQYAAFEIHEMKEAFENIEKYQSDRKETKEIPMINPFMEALSAAIETKDKTQFDKKYQATVQACNTCHSKTGYGFISIERE